MERKGRERGQEKKRETETWRKPGNKGVEDADDLGIRNKRQKVKGRIS